MEDLFKGFAEELEERKLEKAPWLKRGEEHKAGMLDDKGKLKDHPYPTATGQKKPQLKVGHTKDVATKRKELVDDIVAYDRRPGGHQAHTPEHEVRDMHEDNYGPDNMSDDDIHKEHKQVFPHQY